MSSLSPYITPEVLLAAPTGIDWSTIPSLDASPAAQLAEQTRICWRVTDRIDSYCNQALRATINTETILGPHLRLTVTNQGNASALCSRWPVLSIVSANYVPRGAPATTPLVIPSNMLSIRHSGLADFGTTIQGAAGAGPAWVDIAPGFIDWSLGRNGWYLNLTYVNGWPHAGLTAAVVEGATTLEVDDCTGWAGARGLIKDGQNMEYVSVTTASTTAGPGTLTLSAPTQYAHSAGVLVSTLPNTVEWAAILFATAEALTRGGTATTIAEMPGAAVAGGKSTEDLLVEAEAELSPYRRIL